MKTFILLLATAALTASCGGNNEQGSTTQPNQTTEQTATTSDTQTVENKTPDVPAKPDYTKGLDLISKSDCATCHSVAEKMIGPTYEEIAKKYAGKAGAEDTLAQKIIKGGSGAWGPVAMPPHPSISVEDANAMVNYILSINQQ